MPKFDLDRTKSQIQRFLGGFTTGQKVMTGLGAIGLIVVAMLFLSHAPKQQYAPLFSNLDSKDASDITAKLQAKGVKYELADGGNTILVPQSQVYQERLDMSGQGLPASTNDGYALLDKEGLTTSQFKQNVDYQRALEGELTKTIEALDAVDAANVHLVVPQDTVFASDSQKPSASVLVKTKPNQPLDSSSVQAIVNLVASSVQGLSPSDVTVADTKGTVLSAPGLAGAAAGDAHAGDTASYESRVTQSVQQMLDQIYGPGHAIVRVAATLNFDEKATTADAYGNQIADQVAGTTPTTVANAATTPTTGPALTQNQSTETFTGPSGSGTTGVLGVNGAPAAATGGNTNYSKNSSDTTYGVGKVHAEVRTAPGKIERLSVAVIVDGKKVQASDIPNVQSSVQAAVGLDATRGDSINVSRMSFDQSAATSAAKALSSSDQQKKQNALFDMIKALVALLLVGVVLFLAWRAMKKAAAREPIRVPLDLRALEAGTGAGLPATDMARLLQTQQLAQLHALEDHDGPASLERASLPEPTEMDQLEQDIVGLIDRQPEEAAATLRSWLADRRS